MSALPSSPHFSPTFEADGLVFVSGQLAFKRSGEIEGDVVAQTRTCLENIKALLNGRGLCERDIVKTTVWIRHANDFASFNTTYAEYFGSHRPARSTLVCELAHPRALVEIEAIAKSSSGAVGAAKS